MRKVFIGNEPQVYTRGFLKKSRQFGFGVFYIGSCVFGNYDPVRSLTVSHHVRTRVFIRERMVFVINFGKLFETGVIYRQLAGILRLCGNVVSACVRAAFGASDEQSRNR